MAVPKEPERAKLFVGMISGLPETFCEATVILRERFGAIDIESEIFSFDCTDYYCDEMGQGLKRKFIAFEPLVKQEELSGIKILTNDIENRLRRKDFPPRPINLDPGLLVKSKIILASCKDYSHRIYLGNRIYAEVTLQFFRGSYKTLPWTYPDFKRKKYQSFFLEVRKKYVEQLRNPAT